MLDTVLRSWDTKMWDDLCIIGIRDLEKYRENGGLLVKHDECKHQAVRHFIFLSICIAVPVSVLLGGSVKLVCTSQSPLQSFTQKLWEVALSLPGRFLCRRCFTLCVTMEVEPRIAKRYKCHHCCSCKNYHTLCITMVVEPRIVKQYKCHHCCRCKNYQGKGMEGGKKVSLLHFLADQKITSSWKKCVLGHPIARATSYCLLPDTFWLWISKNAFKVGSVKFLNSLSTPSIVKKVCTGSKSS